MMIEIGQRTNLIVLGWHLCQIHAQWTTPIQDQTSAAEPKGPELDLDQEPAAKPEPEVLGEQAPLAFGHPNMV